MQFYDVIKNRESIKNFKSTPIQSDKLERILNATIMSPSWKNNKCFRFIIVDNENEKKDLSKAVINDVYSAANSIIQAPMVAVVVADPSSSGVVQDKEFYLVDTAIAMEHLVLAATNEGYGTCWIASIDENKVRQTLSIPDNYRVVAMTPIGEINETTNQPNKITTVQDHVFRNTWNTPYNTH